MARTDLSVTIDRLVDAHPDYRELHDLYADLRTPPDGPVNAERLVARYALAQVVGEIIDYLDVVHEEFEKSVGLTRREERLRILDELQASTSDSSIEQVANVVSSWQDIDVVNSDQLRRIGG